MKMRDILDTFGKILTEQRHADRLTMYHGTSRYAAKQIAQQGFVPNPEDKHYSAEHEDLESLPGSYFTNDLSVAMRYAHEYAEECADTPAIVVATITLMDAVPDEDVIVPAFRNALKQRTADAFVQTFHRELVGGYQEEFPVARDLMLKMRRAFNAYQKDGDGEAYRDLLNQLCHAYARMVFETNPRYLGGHNGHHTVRLPQGLGVEHIESITSFFIGGLSQSEDPIIEDVVAVLGQPIGIDELQHAVDFLWEQGDLSGGGEGGLDDEDEEEATDHNDDLARASALSRAEAEKILLPWAIQQYPDKTEEQIRQRIGAVDLNMLHGMIAAHGIL